ncbi:hypothetical protein [Dysgonomonas sp. 521]|uniref:hypothetical protein n=1 Tax=Dysgonomonas sp. 521 TaxID=2302932 RepID=UPI001625EA5E|nr:hypothetical protein [Dysgonomonas sp. 521]
MSRRSELEKELEIAKTRIDNAPKDTPKEIMDLWIKELDSLSVELNGLYDDDENEFPS